MTHLFVKSFPHTHRWCLWRLCWGTAFWRSGGLRVICDYLTCGGECEQACVYNPAEVKAKSQAFYCPFLWSNIS